MSQYFDNKDLFMGPKVTQYGSHMVMSQVQKETKKKYWNIDTQFRDDYDASLNTTYSRQYMFSLPQPINDVKSICVKNVEVPVTFYNISSTLGNNFFKITDICNNPFYHYIVIPDGNYDEYALKTAIKTQITGLNLSLVISDIGAAYDGGYSTFTNTSSSNTYIIEFAVNNTNYTSTTSSTVSNSDFDKYSIKSKLGWLLGFRDIAYTISPSSSITSEKLFNLNRVRYLYLVVDEFSANTPNSFISPFSTYILNKNILAKISLDKQNFPFGSVLPANHSNGHLQSDKRTYYGKINLQKLKVQLVNEYGVSMNLNGSDFSFCIEIEYE
jgi:hypothetical protein